MAVSHVSGTCLLLEKYFVSKIFILTGFLLMQYSKCKTSSLYYWQFSVLSD